MELSAKTLGIGGAWGGLTWLLHEEAHSYLGSGAISEVSVAMLVVATLGVGATYLFLDDDVSEVNDLDTGLVVVAGGSLAIAHQITHGSLVPSVADTSLLLAIFSFLGVIIDQVAYKVKHGGY